MREEEGIEEEEVTETSGCSSWWSSLLGKEEGGAAGPVLFGDVGKQAKDLVEKGFVNVKGAAGNMTLLLSCLGPTAGSTITSTASITHNHQKDHMVTVGGILSASFQHGNTKHAFSFDTSATQINATTTYTNFGIPGMTAGVQKSFPGGGENEEADKAHLHYHHDFVALAAKVHGLKVAPQVELSANIGSQKLYAGGSVLYNTQSKTIGMTKAGFGLTLPEFTAAAIVDPFKSTDLYVMRSLLPTFQVGAHLNLLHKKGLRAATVAGSYVWDKHTVVKGRFDDKGLVAGLFEYSPYPLVTFSLVAEFNSLNLKAKPHVGLSFSMLGGAAAN